MEIDPALKSPKAIPPAPDPPDPPDKFYQCSVDVDLTKKGSKRRMQVTDEPNSSKKTIITSDMASASIQSIYHHPVMVLGFKEYSEGDKGPFLIHVCRSEPDPSAGTSIRPIKFGQFLKINKIQNICCDGVKPVGRNRISVEFKSASDANSFLTNKILDIYKFTATIPTFNITRMGLVRNVPVDFSLDEFAESLEIPDGCGFVLKARRLNRKSTDNGLTSWIPTQTVVLTFRGQRLPNHVYSFHTSLPVEQYQLPTIQCLNCCRFGHVKSQCRSKPRCFKCSKDHSGDSCDVEVQNSTCLHCSGSHFASNKSCPEQERQKNIKICMTQNGISYEQASTNYPKSFRSYAETSQLSQFSHMSMSQVSASSSPSHNSSPFPTRSYVKNVYASPHHKAPLGISFDKVAHQSIIAQPSSSLPNGHALSQSQSLPAESEKRQSVLLETLLSLIIELISSSNSSLPSNVAQLLSQIISSSSIDNGSSIHHPMEYKKSSTS